MRTEFLLISIASKCIYLQQCSKTDKSFFRALRFRLAHQQHVVRAEKLKAPMENPSHFNWPFFSRKRIILLRFSLANMFHWLWWFAIYMDKPGSEMNQTFIFHYFYLFSLCFNQIPLLIYSHHFTWCVNVKWPIQPRQFSPFLHQFCLLFLFLFLFFIFVVGCVVML